MKRRVGLVEQSIAAGALALALLATIGCQDKPSFEPISNLGLDQVEDKKAHDFVRSTFDDWRKGVYPDRSEMLTTEMKQLFSPEAQKKLAAHSVPSLGHLRLLHFVGGFRTWPAGHRMYRYKANFRQKEEWELRVTFNEAGQIAGFASLPWKLELD